jgi:hypothetical protein
MAAAQQPAPEVRINYMNVCTPGEDEQKEIRGALESASRKPGFAADFEVSRGRSTMPDAPIAKWVRIRRDFPNGSLFSNAQYTISVDDNRVSETMVLRVREPKQFLQLSIQTTASSSAGLSAMLNSATPAARIKVERFGKSSVGLSRCRDAQQSAYEPLFRTASEILNVYRRALDVRRTVVHDFALLGVPLTPGDQTAVRSSAREPRQQRSEQ